MYKEHEITGTLSEAEYFIKKCNKIVNLNDNKTIAISSPCRVRFMKLLSSVLMAKSLTIVVPTVLTSIWNDRVYVHGLPTTSIHLYLE